MPTRWLRARINAKSFYPPRMLRMAYRIDADALPQADLVVSAGGETQMPNICVTRFLDVPSIFCGSLLRGLEPENFSLIVSSYERDEGSDKHLVVLKPSSIDPDELGRPKIVPRYGPDRRPQTIGLLIGGRAGRFHYRRQEWERLLAFRESVSKAWGTRWLISTSRRTPDAVADRITEIARDESVVAKFIDFRTAGSGHACRRSSPRRMRSSAPRTSSSMISEAVSARLPVVGVSPRAFRFTEDEQLYRDFLMKKGWSRTTAHRGPVAGALCGRACPKSSPCRKIRLTRWR